MIGPARRRGPLRPAARSSRPSWGRGRLLVSDWSATSEEVTEAAPRSLAVSESGATWGESTAFSAISSLPTASGAIFGGVDRVVAEVDRANRAVDDLGRADAVLGDADREGAAGRGPGTAPGS